jgi:CheY-like chemotaxis protein
MRKTILVVEDDPSLRSGMRNVLEEAGYRVMTAENGRVALRRLESSLPPALILLDLRMPELDGWEFLQLRRLDTQLSAVPIVVLSTYLRDPQYDSVLPADGFVRKPFGKAELLSEVARHTSTVLPA